MAEAEKRLKRGKGGKTRKKGQNTDKRIKRRKKGKTRKKEYIISTFTKKRQLLLHIFTTFQGFLQKLTF